jgi:hypothetical protein
MSEGKVGAPVLERIVMETDREVRHCNLELDKEEGMFREFK